MKKQLVLSLALVSGAAFISGCASDAHYVETGGRENIVNVGRINIQDYIQAADTLVQDLKGSGVLTKVANPPAVLAISRIVNNTSQQLDTDILIKKIRVSLSNGGQALTTTTMGIGGHAEDPLAKSISDETAFMNDQKTTRLPDFSLSGKIIETTARAGSTRQSTYSFQLSLTDKSGLAVWEGEKEITKQGARSSVGF
jgi:hypothetical protein